MSIFRFRFFSAGLILTTTLTGCASFQTRNTDSDAQVKELQATLAQLNSRLESMENKLVSMNEKVDATRASVDTLSAAPGGAGTSRTKPTGVTAHPADKMGISVEPQVAETDPQAGFANDDAIKQYRKAMVLFLAENFQDSVLAFSNFVEAHPDHPLAGSAQYYVGKSYLNQGELKLAVQEFQRVLTSYDRSAHVADTLRDMADAEDKLKRPEDAARHRQLLTSLFPQSPAASGGSEPPTAKHIEKNHEPASGQSATPSMDHAAPELPAPLDQPPHPLTAPMETETPPRVE